MTDRLKEQGFKVKPINNGGKADDPIHFANIGTEMCWELKKLFETENISIMDVPNLISRLPGRKYLTNSKGQIIAESKIDMKKRGLKSPDDPDALCLAIKGQAFFISGSEDAGPSFECMGDEDDDW